MPKFPSLKPRDVEKVLTKNGFHSLRQTGSHKIFYNSQTEKTVVVPFHSRDIPQGTIRSIIKQSDLPEEQFLKKKKN